MNIDKEKLREQLSDALDKIELERASGKISSEESKILGQISLKLRNIERGFDTEDQHQLLAILKKDSDGLDELITKINGVSEEIDDVTKTIQKVSVGINIVISTLTSIIGMI